MDGSRDFGLGMRGVVAHEICGSRFAVIAAHDLGHDRDLDSPVDGFSLGPASRSLLSFLQRFLKAGFINGDASLFAEFPSDLQREAECIIKPERIPAVKLLLP